MRAAIALAAALMMPAIAVAGPLEAETWCVVMMLKGMTERDCQTFKDAVELEAARQDARDRARGIHHVPATSASSDARREAWEKRCKPRLVKGAKSYEPDRWVYAEPGCSPGP